MHAENSVSAIVDANNMAVPSPTLDRTVESPKQEKDGFVESEQDVIPVAVVPLAVVDNYPDGGLSAWLVVLGVSAIRNPHTFADRPAGPLYLSCNVSSPPRRRLYTPKIVIGTQSGHLV